MAAWFIEELEWSHLLILFFLQSTHACSSRPSFSPPPTFPSTLNNTNGLLLDKETLSIVQQTLVKTLLDLGKLKFHCPGIDGTFPDLLDCTKYYTCVGSTHTVQECDVGEGYEALAKGCVRNESVPLCQKVQKLPDYSCNEEKGVRIFEGQCDKFIICTDDAAFASSCNHGDFFDPKFKLCLPEGEVNCTRSDRMGKSESDDF